MFTGIVEGVASVAEARKGPAGLTLLLDLEGLSTGVDPGDSILIDGCCLTVESVRGSVAAFTAVAETLSMTTLGDLAAGDRVNVERSVLVGGRMGGHFVFGHVDGEGEVLEVHATPASMRIRIPTAIAINLIPKGSIAVDGVSLTIASVQGDAFEVALVPFTLEKTTLGSKRSGDRVNIETDYLARIVRKMLEERS